MGFCEALVLPTTFWAWRRAGLEAQMFNVALSQIDVQKLNLALQLALISNPC